MVGFNRRSLIFLLKRNSHERRADEGIRLDKKMMFKRPPANSAVDSNIIGR